MQLEPYQIVRELIAGSLLLLNVYLFWSFASNVGSLKRLLSWKVWRSDPAAQGAIALATYFLGALILRGFDWLLFFLTNLNTRYDYPKAEYMLWLVRNSWVLTVLAGAVVIVGGLYCVRVFNPRSRANWMLGTVAILSIFLPFVLHLWVYGWPK